MLTLGLGSRTFPPNLYLVVAMARIQLDGPKTWDKDAKVTTFLITYTSQEHGLVHTFSIYMPIGLWLATWWVLSCIRPLSDHPSVADDTLSTP